ncbi:phosphoribosyltransferase [Fusibacter tunisiensis]|uniref:Amidophosphoribosyltransferase n=1 Tax=Fusibacter tunisiensis TaxID=1008308 RepID=A0ABS2MTW5_9FIRM|nr:phosphoribosyltransferase [Fusibacter tunisiensis]MBM7562869.1 hypothetical protein [Fusibacter tunisiensis]
MQKYIYEGAILYHKYLSSIKIVEISDDILKIETLDGARWDLALYDFGKTLFIEKHHLLNRFETTDAYIGFIQEEATRKNVEKNQIFKNDYNKKNNTSRIDLEAPVRTFKSINNANKHIPTKFIISKNAYLSRDVIGYFHQYYVGFGNPGNPDFINTLKNTFNDTSINKLTSARDKVIEILMRDIPIVLEELNISHCLCICVPRAKSLYSYSNNQQMFKEAVKTAANNIHRVTDGTDCITRIVNTKTTHIRKDVIINDGDKPYPGITSATCQIDNERIRNQNVILIDDIYTRTINIDEDCIQALIDNGAREVVFYSIGYTR